jgi:hypothetical protein
MATTRDLLYALIQATGPSLVELSVLSRIVLDADIHMPL